MGTTLTLCIVGIVVLFVILIALSIWANYASKKKLQQIIEELDLKEDAVYEVVQNGGRTTRDLIFKQIYYGKRSANGNINLRFVKKTSYRGSIDYKEVIIKYGSIWKIKKIS